MREQGLRQMAGPGCWAADAQRAGALPLGTIAFYGPDNAPGWPPTPHLISVAWKLASIRSPCSANPNVAANGCAAAIAGRVLRRPQRVAAAPQRATS